MTEHEQDSKFTKNKRQDGENKMDIQEWIIFAIELIGTVAFSASGAMVGIECSMDIFGVIVLGVSTAVGGGMVRDVILGKVPSALLHPVYVIYAVLAAVLVFCIIYFRRKYLQDGFGEVYDKLMLSLLLSLLLLSLLSLLLSFLSSLGFTPFLVGSTSPLHIQTFIPILP